MKDFKKIADEIMKEIYVTDELKQKTLMRCKQKKLYHRSKLLIPAACLILILGIVNITGLLPTIFKGGDEQNSEFNILMESNDNVYTPFNHPDSTAGPDSSSLKIWQLEDLEKAKKSFGDSFLVPSYVPAGFKLDNIQAYGYQQDSADKIVLNFISVEKSFSIIEDKNVPSENHFTGYKSIDINGIEGYVIGTNDSYAEIHWIANKVHYMVAGSIPEDEAISIAKSMK